MKDFLISLRMLAVLTAVTGVAYPLLMTGLAGAVFPEQASGQLIRRGDSAVGSVLISQKFQSPRYFWGRPSATDHNPLPSGGSNLGPTSAALKAAVAERTALLAAAHEGQSPPSDLVFASGSGLDPHISPEAAKYQIRRVAQARGVAPEAVETLVDGLVEGRQFGLFGEPRVNVLMLNLALDR